MQQVKAKGITENPAARDDLAEELIGQELFLYDERTGETHCLNGGAAIVWMLCDGTRDAQQMAKEIASAYTLSEDQVIVDVRQALGQFKLLGLLKI